MQTRLNNISIAGKPIYSHIGFWIIFFFLLRMVGIINPPLEIGHNWRQITGLMVARNFLEIDPSIFFPRVDETNGATGIIGMEFPSLNYLHYLFSKVFGYSHWYGRLINLIVSSIGVYFFYRIAKKYFTEKHALISAIFLLSSSWFLFSRKMMPDTFCISLMFIGVYYGISYLEENRWKNAFISILFISLAMLSKIPAGIYLAIFIPVFYSLGRKKRHFIYLFLLVIPLLLTYSWYFIWNPYLATTYGNWYNIGRPLNEGFMEIISNPGATLKNFYFNTFAGYVVTFFSLLGIFFMFKFKQKALIYTFVLVFLLFLIYIFKSGYFFYHHSYYIIPFVPVMALLAGYTISLLNKKSILIFLVAVGVIESIANQQHDLFLKPSEKYKLELKDIAQTVSNPSDLIIINGNGNPQQLYLSNRKGWVIYDDQLNTTHIDSLNDKGAKYLFINKHSQFNDLPYEVVYEDSSYVVQNLDSE